MGKEDLTCGDAAALTASVAKIKEGYDEYNALSVLQTEFMERHEAVDKDVYRVVYSNGAELIANYRRDAFSYRGQAIPPMKYLFVEKK
jgi:hypothetical protein